MSRKKPRKTAAEPGSGDDEVVIVKPKVKNTGVTLEKAVARIVGMFDPGAIVTHNRKLKDRLGNTRQYDVVIEGGVLGQPLVGVVECKDHASKKSPETVEAFATKCKYLGAGLRVMVSRLGFTKQALVVAGAEGIACLSLLPKDPDQTGLLVPATVYHRMGRWENVEMDVTWTGRAKPALPQDAAVFDVKYDGRPIIGWFLKQLATERADEMKEGPHALRVSFNRPIRLDVKGVDAEADAVTFRANRLFTTKRFRTRLFGDAVWDWQEDRLTVPNLGEVFTGAFQGDASGFEDVDELPETSDVPIEFCLFGHVNQWDPNLDAVDLMTIDD